MIGNKLKIRGYFKNSLYVHLDVNTYTLMSNFPYNECYFSYHFRIQYK